MYCHTKLVRLFAPLVSKTKDLFVYERPEDLSCALILFVCHFGDGEVGLRPVSLKGLLRLCWKGRGLVAVSSSTYQRCFSGFTCGRRRRRRRRGHAER